MTTPSSLLLTKGFLAYQGSLWLPLFTPNPLSRVQSALSYKNVTAEKNQVLRTRVS